MVVVDRRFMVIMEAARTSEMSVYFNETTQHETTQRYPPPHTHTHTKTAVFNFMAIKTQFILYTQNKEIVLSSKC
jgi:hypothetical protein